MNTRTHSRLTMLFNQFRMPAGPPASPPPCSGGMTPESTAGGVPTVAASEPSTVAAPSVPVPAAVVPDSVTADSSDEASRAEQESRQPDKERETAPAVVAMAPARVVAAPDEPSDVLRLADEVASLRKCLETRIDHTHVVASQAETLKIMSQKLRAVEEDYLFDRVIKPVFLEILLVLDDLAKAQTLLETTAVPVAVSQILKGIETQILQLLARHDITPMTRTPDTFDPTCQKVVGVRAVSPVKVGKVEVRLRPGYRLKDHVLRYEEVVIVNQVKEEK